jgi:hypothetical protein
MEVSGQPHAPAIFSQGKIPWYQCIGGWVGLKTGLNAMVKRKIFSPYRESNPRSFSIVRRYTSELSREIMFSK